MQTAPTMMGRLIGARASACPKHPSVAWWGPRVRVKVWWTPASSSGFPVNEHHQYMTQMNKQHDKDILQWWTAGMVETMVETKGPPPRCPCRPLDLQWQLGLRQFWILLTVCAFRQLMSRHSAPGACTTMKDRDRATAQFAQLLQGLGPRG